MVSITFMIIFHSISQFMSEWIINLERVELPNSSPDLNVIENLWYTLKDCVARDAPRTEAALRRSFNRNWEIITTPQNLQTYFESLHTKYFECMEEGGER